MDCGQYNLIIEPSTFSFLSLTQNSLLTLHSEDMSEVTENPIELTVTAALTAFPAAATETTFFVTVLDPCLGTSLSFDPVVENMIATVNQGATTQVVKAIDSVSFEDGGDGLTICGPRTYSISPTTTHTFLSLIGGDTLKLESSD